MFGKTITNRRSMGNRMANLERALYSGSHKIEDIYSLNLLQSLLTEYAFLPFTNAALRPFCLAHILNDIVVNSRQSIIEFGSGLSTILIGRLIKRNKLNARLLSVEHNQGWANVLNGIVENEGISNVIEIIHAPLEKSKLAAAGNLWYDLQVLDKKTAGKKFDMAIVDGPPAWQKGYEMARYPALAYVYDKLHEKFAVYLDDANRAGEKSVLELWQKEYGHAFTISGGTLAYFYAGESYHTEPM